MAVELIDSSLIKRNDKMLANDVGNETVMMSVEGGRYFGMNKTGSYIWKQLSEPMTYAQLCDRLSSDFDIAEDKCREEIRPFLEEMIKENIIFVA